MKVSREKFAENQERILDVAGKLFREKGFDGIGLADIMKAAGLTHGGFYRHFESKDDLMAAALHVALGKTAADWDGVATAAPKQPLQALMRDYLSAPHRDIRGDGCVFASLGADVARHEGPVREAFTEGLRSFINFVTKLIPGRSHTSRRRQAISTLSEMVGALVLARAVGDAELSDEILAASAARRSA